MSQNTAASIGEHPAYQPQRHYPHYDFSWSEQYLRPLDQQLDNLRKLNSLMGSQQVPDNWFDNVDTSSNHMQKIDDLEHWYVQCTTPRETLRYNLGLLEFEQGFILDERGLLHDSEDMELQFCSSAMRRASGLYRVRTNLVDNWDPEKGRSNNVIGKRAIYECQQLATFEPLAAYALQDPGLFPRQDFMPLPYIDLAGVKVNGMVPLLMPRKLCLRDDHISTKYFAAPTCIT